MNRAICLLIFIVSVSFLGSSVSANEYGILPASDKKTPGAATVNGTFVAADFKKKSFEVVVDGQNEKFSFNGETKFLREDKAIFLSDVLPGEVLEVTYSARGKRKIARSVRVEGSRLLRIYGAAFQSRY